MERGTGGDGSDVVKLKYTRQRVKTALLEKLH